MIKTIVDNADEEERKLDELRQRLSGKQRASDDPDATYVNQRQDFTDSVNDAITDRIAEIQQRRFNSAMDAWLTKTKAECQGYILQYLVVFIFGSVVTFFIWFYFWKK